MIKERASEECETLSEAYNEGYAQGGEDMEKAKQIIIDALGNVVDMYREKIFYLMDKIDKLTVAKDMESLRRLHFENMEWVSENFLMNEYYDYFNDRLRHDNRSGLRD